MPDKLSKQEFKEKVLKERARREKQKIRDYDGYLKDAKWRMKRLYTKENLRSQKAV